MLFSLVVVLPVVVLPVVVLPVVVLPVVVLPVVVLPVVVLPVVVLPVVVLPVVVLPVVVLPVVVLPVVVLPVVVLPVVVAEPEADQSTSNNIFEEIDSQTNIVCVPDILGNKSCGLSSKKLSVQGRKIIDDLSTDIFDFNIFMNMKVSKSILQLVGKCPTCNSNIDLNPDVENKNGLSIPLQLKNAVNELKGDVTQMINIDVSVDVTWQRRGHASLNGVTTVIEVLTMANV